MSTEKEIIKSIHLVCQTGMGDEYKVGVNGVTRIVVEDIFTKPDETICIFVIYRGCDVVAKINANTPFVLTYN